MRVFKLFLSLLVLLLGLNAPFTKAIAQESNNVDFLVELYQLDCLPGLHNGYGKYALESDLQKMELACQNIIGLADKVENKQKVIEAYFSLAERQIYSGDFNNSLKTIATAKNTIKNLNLEDSDLSVAIQLLEVGNIVLLGDKSTGLKMLKSIQVEHPDNIDVSQLLEFIHFSGEINADISDVLRNNFISHPSEAKIRNIINISKFFGRYDVAYVGTLFSIFYKKPYSNLSNEFMDIVTLLNDMGEYNKVLTIIPYFGDNSTVVRLIADTLGISSFITERNYIRNNDVDSEFLKLEQAIAVIGAKKWHDLDEEHRELLSYCSKLRCLKSELLLAKNDKDIQGEKSLSDRIENTENSISGSSSDNIFNNKVLNLSRKPLEQYLLPYRYVSIDLSTVKVGINNVSFADGSKISMLQRDGNRLKLKYRILYPMSENQFRKFIIKSLSYFKDKFPNQAIFVKAIKSGYSRLQKKHLSKVVSTKFDYLYAEVELITIPLKDLDHLPKWTKSLLHVH